MEAGHIPLAPSERSVLHVLALSAGTPAPASTSTATAAIVVARAALASRRWAHKSVVDVDDLFEQLRAVGALDGGFCVVEGRVFDEAVTLPYG